MKREQLSGTVRVVRTEEQINSLLEAINDIESRGGSVLVDDTHFRVLRKPRLRQGVSNGQAIGRTEAEP